MLGARQRRGRRRLAVRQGPLRLPGRPRRRAHHRSRWCATAASCVPVELGEGARRGRRRALKKAGGRRRRARRRRDDQRGGLPPPAPPARRPRLARPRLARRRRRCRATLQRALADPAAAGDRPRPRVRPHRARARLRAGRRRADPRPAHPQGRPPPRHASSSSRRARPTALDPSADGRRCASRPAPARRSWSRSTPRWPATTATSAAPAARRGRQRRRGPRRSPTRCAAAGEDVVIVYGERLLAGPRGDHAARALLNVAGAPRPAPAATAPGCSSCPPAPNGRGLREVGVAARRRPGPAPTLAAPGRDAPRIAEAARRRRARRALPAARRPAARPARTARCGTRGARHARRP